MKAKSLSHNIGIVSLGCAKNLVDTEVMMKQLQSSGMNLILDPSADDRIDTAIINTCGFILDAKQESVDHIMNFVSLKQKGRLKFLYVMGCLSERYKQQLEEEIPEVDGFFGVNGIREIVEKTGAIYRNELLGQRIITTPPHTAWLKIAEGCDRKCSFCSIPAIRGSHISKPVETIVEEARNLLAMGVRELNVISQETTWYGMDLYGKRMIAPLLEKLASLEGLGWIRLHYTHPSGFPEDLITVINNNPKICRYVDIPLQHISDRILKSMKRGINRKETEILLEKIRKGIPGVAVRTTFITGYPGESEEEFNELADFIRTASFDRMGVFAYSEEEGTSSAVLMNQVPEELRHERAGKLMNIQEEISFGKNNAKIGSVLKVLIDREEGDFFIGRTEADSPEIDNEVIVKKGTPDIVPGNFYDVRITSADTFDLYGDVLT